MAGRCVAAAYASARLCGHDGSRSDGGPHAGAARQIGCRDYAAAQDLLAGDGGVAKRRPHQAMAPPPTHRRRAAPEQARDGVRLTWTGSTARSRLFSGLDQILAERSLIL